MRASDDYGIYFFYHSRVHAGERRLRGRLFNSYAFLLSLRSPFIPSSSFSLDYSFQALDFLIRQLKVSPTRRRFTSRS